MKYALVRKDGYDEEEIYQANSIGEIARFCNRKAGMGADMDFDLGLGGDEFEL